MLNSEIWIFLCFICICEDNITRWHGKTSNLLSTHLYLPTTTALPCVRAQQLVTCTQPNWELIQFTKQTAVLGKVKGQLRLQSKVCFPRQLSLFNSPLHGRTQGLLPHQSVKHSLLLTWTLKFHTITSVARLSRLSSKRRHFALEVYINAISKPVIMFLYMWTRAQAWIFSVWIMLSVEHI